MSTLGEFFTKDYITYRRKLLDEALEQYSAKMKGRVLDVGGKKEKRRGKFTPPTASVNEWIYLNVDATTNPTINASADAIPLEEASVDCVVCTEVLEHVPNPQKCVDEIARVLKPGGNIIISTPFLYPVHADPSDFQRFTRDGCAELLKNFRNVEILAMGGFWGVIGQNIELYSEGLPRGFRRAMLWRLGRILQWFDSARNWPSSGVFTTGYICSAVR